MKKTVIAALLALLAMQANAQSMIYGLSAVQRCDQWLDAHKRSSAELDAAIAMWAAGFLSGYNMTAQQRERYDGPWDANALRASVDRFCRADPQQATAYGITRYFIEIGAFPEQRFPLARAGATTAGK